MTILRSLLKDTAIYGLSDLFFKIIAFFTFPLFAHAFTSSEYGLLALVITIGVLVTPCFNCGLNNAVQVRYSGIDANNPSYPAPLIVTTGLSSTFFLGSIIVSLCVGLSYLYRDALLTTFQIEWSWIGWVLYGHLFMLINSFVADVIRLHFTPWKFAFMSALINTLTVTGNLIAVFYLQSGIKGFLISTAIVHFFIIPLNLWMIRRDLTLKFNWKLCKELLRFGYPFIFSGIAFWLFGSMDRWVLDFMSTLHEVGIYSIAFKFVSVMILISQAVGSAWVPHALKMYKEDPAYRATFSRLFSLSFYSFVFCAVGISLFSQEFLMMSTPEAYWSAWESLPFLSMGLACYGASQIISLSFSVERKTHHMTFAFCVAAICNLALNFALIPLYGAQGAAMATFIAYMIFTAYIWLWTQKIHPLPLDYRKLAVSFVAMFFLLAFHLWLQTIPWGKTTVFLKVLFLLTFTAAGYLFRIIPRPGKDGNQAVSA
jgi:O-antigen/teichoic acid export membrane protein